MEERVPNGRRYTISRQTREGVVPTGKNSATPPHAAEGTKAPRGEAGSNTCGGKISSVGARRYGLWNGAFLTLEDVSRDLDITRERVRQLRRRRSNPLSRAHLLMPISIILFFVSALAITLVDLPYSVVVNSKTLMSSPSSHFRCFFPNIAKLSRNNMSTPQQSYRVCLCRAFHPEPDSSPRDALGIQLEDAQIAKGCGVNSVMAKQMRSQSFF